MTAELNPSFEASRVRRSKGRPISSTGRYPKKRTLPAALAITLGLTEGQAKVMAEPLMQTSAVLGPTSLTNFT